MSEPRQGSHCPKVWSTNCSLQSARTLWGSSNSYLRTARLFICPTGQCPTPPSRVDIKLTKFKIKECRTQVFSLTCTDMIIVHCWSTVLCSRLEVSVGSSDLALRKPVWQFLYCAGWAGLGLAVSLCKLSVPCTDHGHWTKLGTRSYKEAKVTLSVFLFFLMFLASIVH